MLIKDLIKELQEIQDSYTAEDIAVLGEPDIYIDVFSKFSNRDGYMYSGICPDITIERTAVTGNLVLSAFTNSRNRKTT